MAPDLLSYWFNNNLIGWLEAVFVSLIGYSFYGLIIFAVGIVSYIRTQSAAFVAVMWITSGAAMWSLLPFEARLLAFVFIVLGVSVAVWKAWFGGR